MILQTKNRILLVLLIMILSGCASVGYRAKLVPSPQGLWVNTSEKFLRSRKCVTYDCDGMKVKVWQVLLKKREYACGCLVVPFIPNILSPLFYYPFTAERTVLRIDIHNTEDSRLSPDCKFSLKDISMRLKNNGSEEFPFDFARRYYFDIASYEFHFAIPLKEMNEFILTFHLDKAVCDIDPLRFKMVEGVYYYPFE